MEAGLRVHQGGSGEPLLVLLHGLGATGDVWARWWPLLARRWPGRWSAPDLPGHGGSPPLAAYAFDGFAVGRPIWRTCWHDSQAPVTLARGEHDPMNTDQQLARLGAPTLTLPGLGHNAHLQNPELSITLLDAYR